MVNIEFFVILCVVYGFIFNIFFFVVVDLVVFIVMFLLLILFFLNNFFDVFYFGVVVYFSCFFGRLRVNLFFFDIKCEGFVFFFLIIKYFD